MFKKSLNVNDAWVGFYSHFKKRRFWLPYLPVYDTHPCIIRTPPILCVHFGQKQCVLYKGKYGNEVKITNSCRPNRLVLIPCTRARRLLNRLTFVGACCRRHRSARFVDLPLVHWPGSSDPGRGHHWRETWYRRTGSENLNIFPSDYEGKISNNSCRPNRLISLLSNHSCRRATPEGTATDIYLLYSRICDIYLSVPCTSLASVSVGYPTMHKALVFLYVNYSTQCIIFLDE